MVSSVGSRAFSSFPTTAARSFCACQIRSTSSSSRRNYLPLAGGRHGDPEHPSKDPDHDRPGRSAAARAAAPASSSPREPAPQPRMMAVERPAAPAVSPAGMNSRNTFDTLSWARITSSAHSASLAVAKAPSRTYNPLFIYGGSGLGKTHLLQAIGHQVISSPEIREGRVPAERAINERVHRRDPARHARQVPQEVPARRRADDRRHPVPRGQGALAGGILPHFSTAFTTVTNRSSFRAIVPPARSEKLEQRLVSRFEWGLKADATALDVETRICDSQEKGREPGSIRLRYAVIEFLIDRIRQYPTPAARLHARRLENPVSLSEREITPCDILLKNLLRAVIQEQACQSRDDQRRISAVAVWLSTSTLGAWPIIDKRHAGQEHRLSSARLAMFLGPL